MWLKNKIGIVFIFIMLINQTGITAESTNANFFGTLTAGGCTINGGNSSNIRVDMGSIDAHTISQVGQTGPWIGFSAPIIFTNCPTNKRVTLKLESTQTEPNFNDYLALTPGGAKCVAIAMSSNNGASVLPLSAGIPVGSNSGTYNLNLKAAYVRTCHSFKVGLANATAQFTLDYQ